MKIKVRIDGTASCVYTDKLDLRALGRIQVTRASRVEFDSDTQMWEAQLTDGIKLGSFRCRDEAITHEVKVLESRL